ncbi:hypothetical protein BGX31_010775 [Mortierella sp. GBA43]|nr:hypothetical protein BGX31_010775 [Mortierella sp. GBA43]
MDQATPSDFYLTLCLYVSFYFLFFTTSLAIPTDQELKDQRRAKSYSEQLDPFLAATRKAHAAQQAKGIAKARAKATFGSVRGHHSRQHSREPSTASGTHRRYRSKNRSSSSHRSWSSSVFASLRGHPRQHSRQRSLHQQQHQHQQQQQQAPSRQGHSSFYFYNIHDDPSNIPPALTYPASLDFRVLHHQTREFTRLDHQHPLHRQQQQQRLDLSNPHAHERFYAGHLSPQRYKPPPRLSRRFPRQNQNRYYHFYPESLFRTKMNAPQAETPNGSGSSRQDGARKVSAEDSSNNNNSSQEAPSGSVSQGSQQSSQQQPQHRPGIGWADVAQLQQGDQIHTARSLPAQGQQEHPDDMQHAPNQEQQVHGIGIGTSSSSSVPGRYEMTCRLEESVTPPTLLAHLRLLRLVQSLVIVDDEDLDFLFLIRSEERYLMFLDLLQQEQPPTNAVPLPPLDVALMWMVHMLAPFRYHEDLLRNYGSHLLNYAFPLERYVASVDIENPTTNHEAFQPCKDMWHKLYPEEGFDLDKNDTNRMFEIQCLWCGGTNVMDSSTYIKFRIDGISIDCAGCGSQCSLETLSSKRLWDGIEAYRADSSVLLAGSLLSPWTGTPDPTAAQREHHHLFFHPRIQFGLDQANVSLNCTWPKVIQTFQDLGPDQYYGVRPTTLARIISSYMGLVEDRLSMDLVAGALRQRDFQKAMMVTGGLAWCQSQVLQRSLDRYQKFMLLARAESKHTPAGGAGVAGMGSMAGGGTLGAGQPGRHALVPTLDIDLAWHTHMLSPAHYRQYQLTHYGRVLNHDDTVQATSSMTKQDFVRTASLWQDLYQEQYSSQQTWRSEFILTPGKLCTGVVFPPYGVYLVWKRWRQKRKAKKLNRIQGQDSNEKKKDKEPARTSQEATAAGAGAGAVADVHQGAEDVVMHDGAEQQQQQQRRGSDSKGKGKVTSETSEPDIPLVPMGTEGGQGVGGSINRSLTPALGLDGRLSNWNGDAAGPDG